MAQSFQPLTASTGNVVEGTVKWFNTTKGFGFVALADGTEAFLHISAVEASGLSAPREGAAIKCEIGPGKKGPQVTRLVEVTGGGGSAAPSQAARGSARPLDAAQMANTVEVEGSVKWFSLERGYGFVTADDGEADIFVHGDCLRRAGLPTLLPEQRVSVAVVTTAKGREARAVRAL
ncbi:MAG TPA: cold shock domain-containing protein [Alphaproteobacteria bacterium]|nr:cold shock domain-containing protein [Alphaproteobacteria bacterium]